MCGGNDIVKNDGLFECQSCGTKYSVEEAKKMMIDGPVEVKGKITIDKSEETNYKLENAKSEYEAENLEECYKLCLEVLNVDGNNYEAMIYKGLSMAWQSTIDEPKILSASKDFERAIKTMAKEFKDDIKLADECIVILEELKDVGQIMLKTYIDYYKKQTQIADNYIKKAKDQSSKALSESLQGLGTLFTSDSYSLASSYGSLADTYSENATYYRNEAEKITKNSLKTFKNGTQTTALALNNVLIELLNNFENLEDDIFSVEFLRCLNSYIFYKDYLTTENSQNQLESIIELIAVLNLNKNNEYWLEHKEEKERLDNEVTSINEKIETIKKEIEGLEKKKLEFLKPKSLTENEKELEKVSTELDELRITKSKTSFRDKETRKKLKARIKELNKIYDDLDYKVYDEKEALIKMNNDKIKEINEAIDAKEKVIEAQNSKLEKIKEELYKNRF